MSDDFVIDGTVPWPDSAHFGDRPATGGGQQFSACPSADIALLKTALLSVQSYLRTGTLTASATVTVADLNLTANTSALVGPELDYVGFNGNWFSGIDVSNSPTSRDFVVAGVRGTFAFSDGVTTSGSATLTSASGGGFVSALIGSVISGSGIPAGTTISAVGSTTSLTLSANATATATGVTVRITRSTSTDVLYMKHRGGLSPTIGFGVTPPDGGARLQVSPQDDEPAMSALRLRRGPSMTGNVLTVHDSTPVDRLWVDAGFYVGGNHPAGGAMVVQADVTNARALVMTDNAKSNFYGFTFPGGNTTAFRCISGGADSFQVGTDGALRHVSTKVGFFAATAITKPTVTGSRTTGAALASLLTALANLGLITDSSSA